MRVNNCTGIRATSGAQKRSHSYYYIFTAAVAAAFNFQRGGWGEFFQINPEKNTTRETKFTRAARKKTNQITKLAACVLPLKRIIISTPIITITF